MSLLDALILGVLQGLTEFFPISSSTHLKIAEKLLAIKASDDLFLFHLACHLGTVFSALIFLRSDIVKLFRQKERLFLLFAATLPLIPCYFLLRPLRQAGVHFQGACLVLTALFLFFASRIKAKPPSYSSSWKFRDVLFIGAMQGMALIPGISRSGSTIAAACFRGWEVKEAVRFSFLLAIPTVLGGNVLEGMKLYAKGFSALTFSPLHFGLGFAASFALGSVGIRMMYSIWETRKLRPFAWYCLGLGFFCLWFLR